ncbi:hypothetical protein CXB51_003463 [Gossypium anomalum]|uniref:Uncharacterized protein n=1 Tax=Gossypium anomalum TaxID=47600 RepID=A0A8J5Z7G9_9ROSI|nr:hypothetical protein CXB51_003463 [Gossypium anomalum]
MQGGCSRVVFG